MEGSGTNIASTGADSLLDQATLGNQITQKTAKTSRRLAGTAQTIALRPGADERVVNQHRTAE